MKNVRSTSKLLTPVVSAVTALAWLAAGTVKAQQPAAVSLNGVSEGAPSTGATPPPVAATDYPVTVDGRTTNITAAVTTVPAATQDGEAVDPDAQAVLHFDLDENTPIAFPTATNRTTTLMFPYPVEDIHGAGVTTDASRAKGDFLAQATPGTNYLSITPIKEGSRRNFNVIIHGRVYAFEAYPAFPRSSAAYTVILDDPTGQGGESRGVGGQSTSYTVNGNALFGQGQTVTVAPGSAAPLEPIRSLSKPRSPYDSAGASRLLGAMDATRLLAGLPDQNQAQQVATLMPRTVLVARPSTDVTDHGNYSVQITHVARFDRYDALGFSVMVTNKSGGRLIFDPESFQVRAGDPNNGPIYYAVTQDMAPNFAAGETRRAFFVIVGDSTGEPNRLDPHNAFSVSLDTMSPEAIQGRTASSTRRHQAVRKIVRDYKEVVPAPTPRH